MEKFFIKIKKFFSIVFSFLFSLFYKNTEKNETPSIKEDNEMKDSISKIKQKEIDINLMEEESNNTKGLDYNFYIKEDFERIYNIIQKIDKIEYQLKTIEDKTTLQEVKKDFESAKQDLKFLENKYRKIEINNIELKKLTTKINVCKSLVEKTEKKIGKITFYGKEGPSYHNSEMMISKVEDTEKKSDRAKILKEEFNKQELLNKAEEKTMNINQNDFSSTKKDTEKKTNSNESVIKENKDSNLGSKQNKKQPEIKNSVISSIVIKDISDDLVKNNEKVIKNDTSEEEKKVVKKISNSKENSSLKKKSSLPKMNQESDSKKKVRKYSVNLDLLRKKIATLKSHSKVGTISTSIKKALKLVNVVNMFTISRNNQSQLLVSHLMINNHIRKARKVSNRKVKPLKYKNILKKISNHETLENQLSYIMGDTLRQIQLLRKEIYSSNELTDEFKKVLEELDEIELDIRSNLEQINHKEDEKHRSR